MRCIILVAVLACAACADSHALPETASSDPVWQLNPDKWSAGVNDLTTPPDVPAAAASPPAARTASP